MQYKEVIFDINPIEPWRDILLAHLGELTYDSFMEEEKGLKAYILSEDFDTAVLEELCAGLDAQILFEVKDVQQQNWNAVWESDFDPVRVGAACGIRADFHEPLGVEHEIIITPKMSFGTGHHATTFVMMQQMLQIDFYDKRILDMGCGTAVLAILAEKLGATETQGIDIDEWAYNNALENLQMNECNNIQITIGGTEKIKGVFDGILANINRNILLNDMSQYSAALKTGGFILFSGFYTEDLIPIKQTAIDCGLGYIQHTTKDNWVAAQFVKR
tara:strand:- start:58 stop:879 length:822 start_codon:yes stop_codon:yes gene_type:complete